MKRWLHFIAACLVTLGCMIAVSSPAQAQIYDFMFGGLRITTGASTPSSCVRGGSFFYNSTSQSWFYCQNGVYTAFAGGGGGTNLLPSNNIWTGTNFFTTASPIFTNSQMNEYLTSSLNGLNFSTEYQAAQGANFSTEGIAGGVAIPNSSTVHQANGISGYVTNSSPSTNAVGLYSQSRCLANGTACWGGNTVAIDALGLTSGVTLYGHEFDIAPLNSPSAYSGIFGVSVNLTGPTGAGDYGIAFMAASNFSGKLWNHGYDTQDGGVAQYGTIGATCSTGTCGSQAIQLRAFNSSSLVTSSFAIDSSGNLVFTLPATEVVKAPGYINGTGIFDASAASFTKLAISPGCATLANGQLCYDSTNNNWHFWVNGADHLMVPLAAGFLTGDCAQPTNSGGTWFLADTGSPCGSGGSGATLQTNGVNNTSQVLLNHVNTGGAGGITFANPSGGQETATLNNTATTVNSQSCTLGSTCTIPFQTGGVGNTSQAGVNFVTSSSNIAGLIATHSNPSSNQERVEISGTLNAAHGGFGIDTSASTGIAQDVAGTWSISTALANGTTATTQTVGDNTTKVATDAFVLANALTNCLTTLGDLLYGGASGICTRLAGPTGVNGVAQTLISVPSGGVATAPQWAPQGVAINAQVGTTYTVNATDRVSFLQTANASPVAVTLPQAGTTGFASNFPFLDCDTGAGTQTLTPTVSNISYADGVTWHAAQTSLTLSTGQCAFVYSDNTNYSAITLLGSAAGANSSLSNITSVNINTSLLAQTGVDLGSTTKAFRNLVLFGAGTYGTTSMEFTGTPTGNRVYTFPDANISVAGFDRAQTFSAIQTFGTNISIGGVTATGATGTGNSVFSISPALTGTPDASGATQFKLPVGAAFATLANGEIGYDTTNKNWHGWQNGADNLFALFSGSLTNGDCAKIVVSTGVTTIQDAGAACGSGGSGTVTSIATTSPITGGTITTTGTIACATCVVASSPGAGIAHFAGSTQTVTSSAVSLTADVSGLLPAANMGTVSVNISTSSPVTVSTTLSSAFYYNQNATAGTAMTFNLPTAAAGKQFCIANSNNGSAANTGVLTIATSATGQFIIFTDGTLSATGGNVTSGGAAADAACVVGVDSTHWQLYTQVGTWTKH